MSIAARLPLSPWFEYRVQSLDGCTLVYGPMPVDHFAALAALEKGAVLSTDLARLCGCTFAWGQPQAVADLLAQRKAAVLARPAGSPELTSLERWLAVGEHGSSALAIVNKLRGVRTNDPKAHPHDADDLRRCLLLLREVPELRAELPRMAEVSPAWNALTRAWGELEAAFLEEAGPNWHERGEDWEAPMTYELMQAALSSASFMSRQGGLFGAEG